MKIAITIWETRISPVFDSARNLLIAETNGVEVVSREVVLFDARRFDGVLRLLRDLDVQVLICGALCEGPAKVLEAHDIEVLSFLAGESEKVLESYIQGRDLAEFSLPGCRWCVCRRRGVARRIKSSPPKEDGKCLDLINRALEEKR